MPTDNRPYRERVEVLAFSPDGKVFGSIYPDTGAFGGYGGGIEEGEDIFEAGAREFQEESGHQVTNLRRLPVTPHIAEWGEEPGKTPEQRKRREMYRGSRTTYLVGDLGPKTAKPEVDKQGRKPPGLHSPDTVMENLTSTNDADDSLAAVNRARAKALKVALQLRRVGVNKLAALVEQSDAHMAAKYHTASQK